MYCRECGAELTEGAKFCIMCGTPTPAYGANTPSHGSVVPVYGVPVPTTVAVPQAPAKALARRGRKPAATVALALLAGLLWIVFQVVGYLVGTFAGWDAETASLAGGAVGAVLGVALLGGKSLLVPSGSSLLLALKKGWWVIAVSLGLMVFDFVELFVLDTTVIPADAPLRFLGLVVMCAAIGVSEEAIFRGLLFESFLDVGGNSRKGVFLAAVVSSVLFGAAHIEWVALDFLDPPSLVQAVLKVVQTGTYGFFLAALVLRSGDLVGAALLHGLDDFLLLFTSVVLTGASVDTEYVSTGSDAWAVIILYLVLIALYVPLVVMGVRMLKEAPLPDRGAFHKE